MSATTKSRSIKKPTLSSSATGLAFSKTRSKELRNEAQSLLQSSALDNIEIEYIKNLQQQVYFLEMECNYLRQQLNLNGLQTNLKYDQKSQQLKNEMLSIQLEKSNLEKSLIEENEQKENVLHMLEHTEKSFHKERELLLKEIAFLKKQKLDAEEGLLSKSVELSRVKENLSKHHFDANESIQHFSKVEQQLENVRRDNLQLRAEINEARSLLISRDSLIKDLQGQLSDPALRKANVHELKSSLSNLSTKLTITNEALAKETVTTKHMQEDNYRLTRELENLKSRFNEINKENTRLSSSLELSLKQNEADLIMAKKNADLAKLNYEKLQNELETERTLNSNYKTQIEQLKLQEKLESKNQFVFKKRLTELEDALNLKHLEHEKALKALNDQHRSKHLELENEKSRLNTEYKTLVTAHKALEIKFNDLNDSIDKQNLAHKVSIENTKTKATHLQSELDDLQMSLANERNANKELRLKVDGMNRQESIHNNLITSLKLRITELENQLNEYTLKEADLLHQIKQLNEKNNNLREENIRISSEIELLSIRLKEIDRLKQLEDLVSSQRWGELGMLAENMKNLSVTMATSTAFNSSN